jgi:hypothetical protein
MSRVMRRANALLEGATAPVLMGRFSQLLRKTLWSVDKDTNESFLGTSTTLTPQHYLVQRVSACILMSHLLGVLNKGAISPRFARFCQWPAFEGTALAAQPPASGH